ncbi:unnamed protein product [Tilletia controversa]|nr:unnamed protein product [Tilletia controversa]CAD6943786.1 unnamed protein product [Tilletia controversa]CAD6984117.1 unnamed protein product [Tilletia controversa]
MDVPAQAAILDAPAPQQVAGATDPFSSLSAAKEKHARFLSWCSENEVRLHESLELKLSSGVPAAPYGDEFASLSSTDLVHHGMCVHAKARIAKGAQAATIPKTAILSPQSSSLSQYDPTFVPCTIGGITLSDDTASPLATPHLALCLLHEFILGPKSRFWPYLDTLPPYGVELSRQWVDGSPEYSILKHTETEQVMKRLQRESSAALPDHTVTDRFLRQFFFGKGLAHLSQAHPGLVSSNPDPSSGTSSPATFMRLDRLHEAAGSQSFSSDELWRLYDMAATLVSTRSFVIDWFHVLAMVPIADAFNHKTSAPHVEFECDDVVCTDCGALYECEHDGLEVAERSGAKADDPDTVTLTVIRSWAIPRGRTVEIFNSYGDLSVHQLLIRFGFATNSWGSSQYTWSSPASEDEDGIEVANALGLSPTDVQRIAAVVDGALQITRAPLEGQEKSHFYKMDPELADSCQIPEQDPVVDYPPVDPSRPLYVYSSGFFSDSLWLFALASELDEARPGTLDVASLLEVNAQWWHPFGIRGKIEAVGLGAAANIRRLVQRRFERLEHACSVQLLKTISQRAEYWIEYTDAMDAHLRWSAARQERLSKDDHEEEEQASSEADNDDAPARHSSSCAHAAGVDTASVVASTASPTTQPPAPAPIAEVNGPMLLQILNLVTQGLLSCSHQSRMLEAHLRNPATSDTTGEEVDLTPQPALARLLGTVQDLENRLLRTTVKRDQLRTNALHAVTTVDDERTSPNDPSANQAEIDELQRERHQIREEINEAMAEVQAEIAELQADQD